jgi:dipeptidyl-peptidase-4
MVEKQILFFISLENGSINRAIYRIALNGKSKLALSDETGTNDATFSPNYQYYINTFSSSAQATTYSLNEAKTGQIKVIENNAALVAKLKTIIYLIKSFCSKTEKEMN